MASAERAAEKVAQGFTGVKFDPAGQYNVFDGRMPDREALSRSAAFCRHIREAVGDKADLLFGTHGQFTAAGAIRLAEQIAPYDPLWFEEPVPPDNPAEMAKVARLRLFLWLQVSGSAVQLNLPPFWTMGQQPYCNLIWPGRRPA